MQALSTRADKFDPGIHHFPALIRYNICVHQSQHQFLFDEADKWGTKEIRSTSNSCMPCFEYHFWHYHIGGVLQPMPSISCCLDGCRPMQRFSIHYHVLIFHLDHGHHHGSWLHHHPRLYDMESSNGCAQEGVSGHHPVSWVHVSSTSGTLMINNANSLNSPSLATVVRLWHIKTYTSDVNRIRMPTKPTICSKNTS